ncbi:uncharacterized protein LOC128501187 [Spea bombifrons]|uniref:uncharacterized protein LOC128501187 n=1 Tax=Spea bombifrons TaxID=233779 RepID=UPI00234B511B|nr:uncharacterized protein LOC128501187 [Spea bombifrons]
MAYNDLRDFICDFTLDECSMGNQGYNRVLLQLFGYLGHGKSSFINSCKFVLDGEYKIIAEAGIKDGGLTMERKSYRVTDSITLVDNRGFGFMNDFEKIEIYAQLANFVPLDEPVEWKKTYNEIVDGLQKAEMDPQFTDLIVPILIYSVVQAFAKEEESTLKTFISTCRKMTGITPIVVLTNKTSGNFKEFKQKFERFGAEVVFGVENYTEDDHLETRGRHMDILNILKNALDDVRFRMQKEQNPKTEQSTRKTFLLKMAHEIDKPQEDRENERQEERKQPANQSGGWFPWNLFRKK